MGEGSVATAHLSRPVGRAQLSAIYSCAQLAKSYGVPVIADGGLKNTGCLIKALTIGASCVMISSLLAGVDESPGEYFYQSGTRLKNSESRNQASAVSGAVVDRGPLSKYFPYLCQSIRHGLQDMGTKSLITLHEELYSGGLRFELRSPSAQREGGIHDLHSFSQRLYA